ncbi:unannotated protein [freshwater metagenome]|uniref:Unannotated protein n=1 Tax=freshwater metagenome TaxID=449393 RepID=A0A6J5ZZK3_9ZZZZ
MAIVANQDDRVTVLGELDRLAVNLGYQRAGRVDRLQFPFRRLGVDRWSDTVSREDRDRAFGDRIVQLVDKDRAGVAQLLDDVLVVDDLLTDVDRCAVGLERALDRLDGAIDSGAVTARSGEQNLLWSIHWAQVYEELAAAHLVNQAVDRFAGHVECPRRELVDVVGERVTPRIVEIDQVDCRDPALEKWCVVVVDRAP